MMKNRLRDVDVDGGVVILSFSVDEANVRVVIGFGLIGATFAVMPNFETADWELTDIFAPNSGTVSSDDDDEIDFDFCDVYDANLNTNWE